MRNNSETDFITAIKPVIIEARRNFQSLHLLDIYLKKINRKDLLQNEIFGLICNSILSTLSTTAENGNKIAIEINKQLADDYEYESETSDTMRNKCESETVDLAQWPIPNPIEYQELDILESSDVIKALAAFMLIKAGY
ncbi:MAG TPA: hypothetical protein PL089_14510 [Ignavibacteria bacterium]|nr:hypothetical protein [Ignavibacteria bacterium]